MKTLFNALLLIALLWPAMLAAQAQQELVKTVDADAQFLDSIDLSKNAFQHETRIGAIFTTGNTRSFSVSGNSETLYRIKRFENRWRLGAYFNRIFSTTTGTGTGTIARYIFGTYRLDYYFLQNTTVYVGGGGYTDEIKGIDTAGQGFTGISHYLFRTKRYSLNVSFGYDFTFEDRVAPEPNETIHSATSEINYLHHLNDIVSFSQAVYAWENLQAGRDFRLNSDTELKVKMNSFLALVLGYHLRFDNTPVTGFKKLDTISDLSLAVTF